MSVKRSLALLLSLLLVTLPLQGVRAAEGNEGPGKALYFAMEPAFVVNIQGDGRRTHFMQIKVQIMSRDPAVIAKIEENQPPLRDAMIMLLAHQSGETMRSVQGREQVRAQALQDIQKVMLEVAGLKRGIEAVYFTDFVIQ